MVGKYQRAGMGLFLNEIQNKAIGAGNVFKGKESGPQQFIGKRGGQLRGGKQGDRPTGYLVVPRLIVAARRLGGKGVISIV